METFSQPGNCAQQPIAVLTGVAPTAVAVYGLSSSKVRGSTPRKSAILSSVCRVRFRSPRSTELKEVAAVHAHLLGEFLLAVALLHATVVLPIRVDGVVVIDH